MSKVSVIIASRNEKFLNKTVEDAVGKASGEVEVIAILDGPTDYPPLEGLPNVRFIPLRNSVGMRAALNLAVRLATGKYVMKLDAHSMMSEGYDALLQDQCDDNWVVVARRNELDAENWRISDTTPCDYFYLSCPWTSPNGYMRDYRWVSRGLERADLMLDETMTISGSMWFMSKEHYEKRIRYMDADRFGHFGEPQELCCKTWLSDGRVMVNKRVLHAHYRGKRNYFISWKTSILGYQVVTQYWSGDKWPYRIHDFGWIVDRFWPLPTEATRHRQEKYRWEPDWRTKYYHA